MKKTILFVAAIALVVSLYAASNYDFREGGIYTLIALAVLVFCSVWVSC